MSVTTKQNKEPFDIFDKRNLLSNIESFKAYVQSIPVPQPCSACFWHGNGTCKKANMEIIPPEVLPVGCSEFEFNKDSVPF